MQPVQQTVEELRQLLARHNFQLVILFGSMAKGSARPDSDIDVAVMAQRPLTAAQKMTLIGDIAAHFERPVDLIDLKTTGGPLLGSILDGIQVSGSRSDWASLLSRHLIDEADFGPLRERILKARRDAWLKPSWQTD